MSTMVSDPRDYFSRFIPERDALLRAMETEAQREQIPIIGPVVGQLLYILARSAGARRVLELGTARGYSALWLARACSENNGRLVTIEGNPAHVEKARANVHRAGFQHCVECITGDAFEEMSAMPDGSFDFVFVDIDKVHYPRIPEPCAGLLAGGGMLVVDNIGFSEADSLNRSIAADKRFSSVLVYSLLPGHAPEHDGLCLALRS